MLTETVFKPTVTLFLGQKKEQRGWTPPHQTTAGVQWTLYFPTWIWALLQGHSCRSCGDGEPEDEVCPWNLGVIFSKSKEGRGSGLWDHQGSSVWWAEWCCGEGGGMRRDTGRFLLRARLPASRASCPTGLLPGTRGTLSVRTLSWRVCSSNPPTVHRKLNLWFGLWEAERFGTSQVDSWESLNPCPFWGLLLREPPIAKG